MISILLPQDWSIQAQTADVVAGGGGGAEPPLVWGGLNPLQGEAFETKKRVIMRFYLKKKNQGLFFGKF